MSHSLYPRATPLLLFCLIGCEAQVGKPTPTSPDSVAASKQAESEQEKISAEETEASAQGVAVPPSGESPPLAGKAAPLALTPPAKELPPSEPCGQYTCYRFAEARLALVPLILSQKARVIGIGEAHSRAGKKGRSTVTRFSEDLLPTISAGSSYLMVELLAPPKEGCQKEKAIAKEESKKITKGQSESNQNEYLAMGKNARSQGVVPDILRATCSDFEKIAAKDGGVLAYMETISRLFQTTLKERVGKTKKGRPLVLAYGGALHNDARPREGRESWSYGPALLEATEGAYLELDLISPSQIEETDTWRSFAWYDAYRQSRHESGALLMKWGEHSYTLFFPPSQD